MSIKNLKNIFEESINVKRNVLNGDQLLVLEKMSEISAQAIMNGNKLMLCGNGGSAADAQHLAAEMLIRLRPTYNRESIPAISLAQDISTITACGNDFGYEVIFERLVEGLGIKGDILIGISTSGNSLNVIKAMKAAKLKGIQVFGFLGSGGGQALNHSDYNFLVPSDNTARIQESHITAGHALMESIEDKLLSNNFLNLKKS